MSRFGIASKITHSSTLPAAFYREKELFEESKEKIFAASWHYITDVSNLTEPGSVFPFTLLEGVLNEPLVLVRDLEGELRCLSNVCTHRGKVIVEEPGKQRMLTCTYHGRCFHLDGKFKRMPAFEEAVGFPSEDDHPASIPVKEWMGMIFVSLSPKFAFEEAVQPIIDRIGWMPTDSFVFEENGTKNYPVNAHWALYCDNYLEGFHIPFVHPALNDALAFEEYETENFPFTTLQKGVAKEGEPHFDIPSGKLDYGRKIFAYYFHLFPNLMFNFYPWGLSLNIIEPQGIDKTMVRFRTYRFNDSKFDRDLNILDVTEMEDEEVVESVQLGVQSRFYKKGRFSPKMEKCVHRFHQIIDDFMT